MQETPGWKGAGDYCFFSEAGLGRAEALAPQLHSVWVAVYQGSGVLLSGSIGFTFAGVGPLPQRSDLVVGMVEQPYYRMLYVLSWAELEGYSLETRAEDWLLTTRIAPRFAKTK
jgi:hypothetical protein